MPRWVDDTEDLDVITPDGTELVRVAKNGASKAVPISALADADLAAHVAASDPHAQYLKEATARDELGLDTNDDVTFKSVTVDDVAYDATTWNGSNAAPTRNAVRDKIASLAQADIGGLTTADSPQFAGINLGHADTEITRGSVGNLLVNGWPIAQRGGAFSGHASIVSSYRTMTAWPVGLAWQANEDRLWCFEWVGPSHGPATTTTQLGARIECWYTEDNGNSKLGRRTIYSDTIQRPLAGCAFGNMSSGRIGGIVCVSDSASTVTSRDVYFVYSDDNCATWTWTELTGLSIDHFAYGMLEPLPTAYGGNDANGYCVVTYAGTTEAKLIKTTDNGANWTEVAPLLDGDATITNPKEPSLVFTSQGAILFARAGGSANLFAAKSADLSTWSAWVDTGVALGENPVHAVVDSDDFVHVAICDRDDFTSAVNENIVRTYRIAATTLYADLTALTSVTPKLEWNFGYRGIGYFQSKLVGSEWYHFVKVQESASTANAASATLALITTTPRPSPSMTPQLPPRQIMHNPAFDRWTGGTSFLNQTAEVDVADRWVYFPSGSTADITQVALTEVQRLMFPHRPRFGIKLDTIDTGNVHSDFVGLVQYHRGDQFYDLLSLLQARQEIDIILYGIGTPIPTGRVATTINYGSGGSSAVNDATTLTQAYQANDGSWVATARVSIDLIGDPTIGTNPYIRIGIDCSFSATAFATTIVGFFAYAGVAPDEPIAPDSITNALQCMLADAGSDTAGALSVKAPVTAESLTLGSDLSVADGGTGASEARDAAANLSVWHGLGLSSVAATHTGNTSETTLATITIPAGAMGANGMIRVTSVWSYTNSANNKTLRVRFGGASGTQYTAATVTTTSTLRTQCQIGNRNSVSSQVGGSVVSAGFGTSTGASVTSAVNTSASTTIVITGQLANSGESVTLESYVAELLYQQ